MPASPFHVVIVGGGISGLSTAFFVMEEAKKAQRDVQCTVIERDVRWGGPGVGCGDVGEAEILRDSPGQSALGGDRLPT